MANKPPKSWVNPKTGIAFYDLGIDPAVRQSKSGRLFQLRQWVAIGCRVCGGAFVVTIPQSQHPSMDSAAALVTCPEHRGQLVRDKFQFGQQEVLDLIRSAPNGAIRYSEIVNGVGTISPPTAKRHIKRLKEGGLICVEAGLIRAIDQEPPTP